jgi:hypothetical protein
VGVGLGWVLILSNVIDLHCRQRHHASEVQQLFSSLSDISWGKVCRGGNASFENIVKKPRSSTLRTEVFLRKIQKFFSSQLVESKI